MGDVWVDWGVAMRKAQVGFVLLAATIGFGVLAKPAAAEFFGCDDQHKARTTYSSPSYSTRSYSRGYTHEFSAQSTQPRTHVTIYPRQTSPGPGARRHCRSWLAQEYRLSGTVVVPRMQCWWQ